MAEYSFTEQGEHEQGFAEVFHEKIVPILQRHEAERGEYRRKALTGMGMTGTDDTVTPVKI